MIEFFLNQNLVQCDDFRADTTLLNYLRLQAGLVGTKEGCASGDCGACTVVIASSDKNGEPHLSYKSLNSCICLLGCLHGKQVITVEGLQNKTSTKKAKNLHPVQKALVDEHGSQCGFCTPGFVMSLFAMNKNKLMPENKNLRDDIIENIDGNLCRCTGYRPIIDAAEIVLNQSFSDDFDNNKQATLSVLNNIKASQSNIFFHPENIAELTHFIRVYPQAKLLAGGTDLALDITQGLQKMDEVIYLANVKELKVLKQENNKLLIGAALPYQDSVKELSIEYPALNTHLSRLGSLQIRNVGTIGGNIANASPIADMPPVLMALNASLVCQRDDAIRHVSLDDFYLGYKKTVMQAGEFIREIQIPTKKADHYLHVYKISKRYADDISAVCGAFYLHFKEGKIITARIAFGGMAATIKRAKSCEKALINQNLNNTTLEEAQKAILNDFDPLDDVRASRSYRLKVAQNCIQRLFIELGEM